MKPFSCKEFNFFLDISTFALPFSDNLKQTK